MKKMPLRLMGNNVLVERLERKKTSGGILVPETAADRKAERAVVIAVGPGGETKRGVVVPIDLAEGEHVALEKWVGVGVPVKVHGRDMLVVDADEIMAVLDPDADYQYGVDNEAAAR